MNRAVVVAVTCLVLVSTVVPASALSNGAFAPSLDEAVDGGGSSVSPSPPAVSRSASTDTAPALAGAAAAPSAARVGNTGFEEQFYYVDGTVNTANGNLYVPATDLSFGALGGEVALERSYNSLRSGEHGPFGFGWTHTYDVHLDERDDGSVLLSEADGSVHRFVPDGSGGFLSPAELRARLRTVGGGHAVDYLSGTTYRFDSEGRLLHTEDRNGNRIELSYTGDRFTSVAEPSGRTIELTYTPEGRIATATGPLGRTVRYGYETGELVSVTDPAGRTTRYAYYDNHKLERAVEPSRLARLFGYDRFDRVRCMEIAVEGSAPTAPNDCDGFEIAYDAPNGTVNVTTVPTGRTTALALDDAGSPTRVETEQLNVSMAWDAGGNLLKVTNRTGTTTFTYDTTGNLLSRTDVLGNEVRHAWRVVETADTYLALRTSTTDERGATTTYDHDDRGNLVSVTNPLGDSRTLEYDSVGNRISETDFGGHETTYTYDGRGYFTSSTDPVGATRTAEIDDAGRITRITDPRGNTVQYFYDALDRIVRIRDPTGNETLIEYGLNGGLSSVETAAGRTITPEFSTNGDAGTVESDSRGNIARLGTARHALDRRFDAVNRLEGETVDLGPTSVDIEYGYDAAGNLVSRTVAGGTTIYEYDAMNRVVGVSGPDGSEVSYTYDAAGRRVRAAFSNGVTTHYEYDAAGRLLHLHAERPVAATSASAGTTIDGDSDTGTPTESTGTPAGTATPNGMVAPTTAEPDTSEGTVTSTSDGATATATPGETATPTPEETATPTPEETATSTPATTPVPTSLPTPTPDGANATTDAERSGTPTPVGTATGTTETTETAMSTPTPTPGSGPTDPSPVGANAAPAAGNETLFSYNYTYDAAGNRLTDTDGAGRTTSYTYDDLNRLTAVEYPNGGTVAYTYDAVGNRLTRTVNGTERTAYTYSATDELLSAGPVTYGYDAAGNRINRTDDAGTTRYAYGPGGRLTDVTLPGGESVSYTYLPSGERLSRTTDAGTTYHLYSRFDPVGTVDSSGDLTRRYVQAPGVDEMLGFGEGGDAYFYHYDPSGNVRAVTDANGSVVNAYEYDAFGTLRRTEEAVANPYRFAGRYHDDEAGLYYNRLRYYDPESGRFTREDPAGLAASVNFYAYAENNPLKFRDPSGLVSWGGACIGGGGMAVVVGGDLLFCQLINSETGQTCDVTVYAFKFGGGLGIGGGASFAVQSGPPCGSGLEGGNFGIFGEANAGCLGASVDINTEKPGIGATGGAGTECGVGAAGGGKYTYIQVDNCSCECDCGGEFCRPGECREDDDDDRPPGGDHPDDNHDLSVLGYDSVYPGFEYDRGASIAVLDRGFVDEFEDFLAARDLRAASVDVRTPQAELDRYDVLVVPTGGLLGLNSLASFEAKLDAYVRNGGTLVVLPQQRGYEFGPVPGELRGYGWLEDQSCQFSSIGVTNACAVVASVPGQTASVNVDGYFTDWPEDATVQLSRTVNGQPAMLSYDHGEGRVLATTIYTDWASGHHASSAQGEALLTNVLAWATSPPDVPYYRRGDTVDRGLNVTNYGELTVDELRVDLQGPGGTVQSIPGVRTSVAGFANATVAPTYGAPSVAGTFGIWTVGYTLVNDSFGEIQRVEDADRFALGAFSPGEGLFTSENITFAVSSDAERYADGSNATFRITIRNSGTENETVTAWWAYPHNYGQNPGPTYGKGTTVPGGNSALYETVVVPAGGEETIVDEIPVYSYDRLWAQFYRGDRNSTEYLGRTSRGFYSFRPAVETDVTTARTEYRLGEQVDVSLRLAGDGGQARTAVRVLGPESTLVFEEEVLADFGVNNSSTFDFRFDLPADASPGFYTAVAEPEVGGEKVGFDSAQFFVPDARIRAIPSVPSGVANGSQVSFTLVNVGQEASLTGLDVSLVAPDGTTVWSDSAIEDVPLNDQVTVPFTVRVGPRQFGEYRLVYTVTPEREGSFTRRYTVSSSAVVAVGFDRPSYAVREDLRATVTVTNDGGFGGGLPVEVAVPAAGYTDTGRLTVAPGENASVEHVVPLPTDIGAGEHQVRVTLGGADASTRTASFVVPSSSLETELASGGPFAPDENVSLRVTNTGGVDTNASCALVVTGPRGVRVDERTVRTGVVAGGTSTVDASLPEQAISGTYFLGSTCDDLETGERVSGTETFAVDGLDASLSMSTDREVYASGEDVNVTVVIDNRGDAVENGTLTVEVTDPSPEPSTSATTNGVPTVADRAAPTLPVVPESTAASTAAGVDAAGSAGAVDGTWFTSASLVEGTPPSRLAASAPVSLAAAANVVGNVTITNDTVWTDRVISVDGFVVVGSGGSLTLRNTTLVFEVDTDLDAGLEVRDGGTFRLLDRSTVTSTARFDTLYFAGLRGSTVELRDSTVSRVGERDGSFTRNWGPSLHGDGVVVENVTFAENGNYALLVYNSSGATVRNSSFEENQNVRILEATGASIEGNTFARSVDLQIDRSSDVRVVDNDFDEAAVETNDVTNVTINGNAFVGRDRVAVTLRQADGSRVEENTLDGGLLDVDQTDGTLFANNTIRLQFAGDAFDFYQSSNNTLRGNDVDGGDRGFELDRVTNTSLVDNVVNGSEEDGIAFRRSSGVTMRGNAFTNTTFDVDRRYTGVRPVANYRHDIDTSNTVDGGAVHYLVGPTDTTAPTDGGLLYLVGAENVTVAGRTAGSVNVVGSRNVTVRDSVLGDGSYGVYVNNATGTTVTNVTAAENVDGILLLNSNASTVSDSVLRNNTEYGIRIEGQFRSPAVGAEVRGNRVTGDHLVVASIFLEFVEDGVVAGNDVFRARDAGIHVLYSPGVVVDDNRITEGSFGDGIEVGRDGGTITNNVVAGGSSGIELWGGSDSLVEGNEVTGAARAFEFDQTTNTTVRANRVSDVRISAFDGQDSTNDTVVGNVVRNVSEGGFVFGEASSLVVRDNRLLNVSATGRFGNANNPVPAIVVRGVSFAPRNRNVTIENNTVTANGPGIELRDTDTARLDGNALTNTGNGFVLTDSFDVTVRNHTLGTTPFDVTGERLRYYVHDIDGSNTVAGSPIAYLLNRTDATVDGSGFGQVWLVNATNVTQVGGGTTAVVRSANVTVADVVVSGVDPGVRVVEAANVTVSNATVRDVTHGVYALASTGTTVRNTSVTNATYGVQSERYSGVYSNNTTVVDSSFVGNRFGVRIDALGDDSLVVGNEFVTNEWGIYVDNADDVVIRENELTDNEIGILLDRTERALVRTNVVTGSDTGIYLDPATDTLVYDNYLDNPGGTNARETFRVGANNRWNVSKTPGENIVGGPFLGGNFWGDYAGADIDGDGLGDTDFGQYGFAPGDFHPLVEPVDRGPVVWSGNFTVDVADATADTVTVTVPGGVLSGSAGKLKVSAVLASTSNQTVAFEDPPFYVLDGDTVLTLEPDARQYKPGETVTLSGRLENRGSTESTYDLSVEANGTELLARSVTLGAGDSQPYETTVTATSAGTLPLQASAGGVVVDDRVEVIAPRVTASIDAPGTVGRAPFDATLEVENTGRIDAALDLSFLGTSESVTLAPNETRLFTVTTSVSDDATLEATITGDATRTVTRTVTFGESATVSLSPATVYSEGTLAVPYTVENTGSLPTEFDANFTLDGRTRTRTVYLPTGGSTNGSLVYDLAAGEYALDYESPFGNGSTTVRVAERNQVALAADATRNVTNATLVVNVSLANTGPNDVDGEVRINSTSFDTTTEFSVAAGETLNRTVNVTVPEGTTPGTRNVTVEAYTEGERLGRVTDRFDLVGARVSLVSGPGSKTYGPGETARLNLTLANGGNAEGDALLSLAVPGIHEEERRVFLAPDERRVVTVTFLVPEDLAAGTYPVEYRLDGGPTGESDLLVEGLNVSVSATLNGTLYENGDTAGLTLEVTNEASFPATLFSRVQYNGYDEVTEFDLDANGTTTVAFDVPVRDGPDRKAFYSVYAASGRSLYIDGAYLHRADPNVTLYTDRQVYEIGETVTVTVEPSTAGRLDVYAPGFTFGGNVTGQRELEFAVPDLRSGSYNVVYAFENTTRSYPFDVDGYTARVLESSLDADGYTGGDDFGLSLDVEADRAVPVTVTASVYGEDPTPLTETTTTATLSTGRNRVTVLGSLPANTSGVHSVVYRIDAALSTPIGLATGSEYFDVVAPAGTNVPPVARFDYDPTTPTAGETVRFDAGRSTDTDGSIRSFEWDLDGDLSFDDATGRRVDHAFAVAGDYTVSLRVTDDGGLANVTRRTVSVDAAPTPTPTPPTPTPTPRPDDGGGSGGDSGGSTGGGGVLPGSGPTGEVELAGATLVTGTVTAGAEVVVEVSLSNFDPDDGRLALTLTADGVVLTERTVTVEASTDRTARLRHRFGTPGTYELAVNGVPAGTVTVEPRASTPTSTVTAGPSETPTSSVDTPTATPEPDDDPGTTTATRTAEPASPSVDTPAAGPGFTVLLVLLAFGLFGLLARRRR